MFEIFRKVPMRGTIKAYSLCVNAGVIECEAGNTYEFKDSDWSGNIAPLVNDSVRFEGFKRIATRVSSAK